MIRSRWIASLAGLLLVAAMPACAQGTAGSHRSFDADRAWASFEKLLRQSYGYFERPGVDGEAILAEFAPRAKATANDRDFIRTLQLASRNFADPHFVVGPARAGDWAIVPTSADLFAMADGTAFRLVEVRAESDALAKGLRPGMRVVQVDGLSPRAAIEAVTGRPYRALSPLQANFAFNVALAGKRGEPRRLEMADETRTFAVELAATSEQAERVSRAPLLSVERVGELGIIRINNSLGDPKLLEEFESALARMSGTAALLIDLRNTPSGGNTSVARGLMGHFVDREMPYQVHVVPFEGRVLGPPRKFVEYVLPYGKRYRGKVYVAGGRWTGSMGEGLMVGFDAIGATTVGSVLGHLLGATSNESLEGSGASIDLGTEQLFTVGGQPREAYRPRIFLERAERGAAYDPVLKAIGQ